MKSKSMNQNKFILSSGLFLALLSIATEKMNIAAGQANVMEEYLFHGGWSALLLGCALFVSKVMIDAIDRKLPKIELLPTIFGFMFSLFGAVCVLCSALLFSISLL